MQTFLPYADFVRSAQVLDRSRLGSQCREGKQLLASLFNKFNGYHKHPASIMWRGHADWLYHYTTVMIAEWHRRGYNGHELSPPPMYHVTRSDPPWWLGNPTIHDNHQGRLLDKSPSHYEKFGWTAPMTLFNCWANQSGGFYYT